MKDQGFNEGKLLLIDKPLSWTSFDVVNKLRYALRLKKIGHAGTLDPLATGLLLIGTGKYTKKLHELQGLDKEYIGVFEIGKTTPSYDLETPFDSDSPYEHVTEEEILAAAKQLTGQVQQVPPVYSAIKIKGERAYKKARNKEDIKLDPREVQIHLFEITGIKLPEVEFRIRCSKGTYIRSMARDFGELLGAGAYLKSLRRTQIGSYQVKDAQSPEEFISQCKKDDAD